MEDLAKRLQWRHLKLLHEINQTGQLSAAAHRLAMTQPAASKMLADIERVVGRPVFERIPKGMVPTPMGEILASYAEDLIHGLRAMAQEAENFERGIEGSLRIGSVTGAAVSFVVPVVQALKESAEGADIQITVGPSDTLVAGLVAGQFDYILSRLPAHQDPRSLEVLHGREESVRFMMRAGHPLLNVGASRLQDLEGFDWVIQSAGTPLRQAVQEAFIARGIPLPRRIVNTSSLLVMIAYLQTSDFVTPVTSEVADLMEGAGAGGMRTIRTREDIVIAPYHLIQRKGYKPIPLARRFHSLLIERLSGTAALSDLVNPAG